MAQVTVFGLLDVGYGSTETKTTGASGSKTEASTLGRSGQQAGGRLGFRGEEDLGGGMKAGFMYEISMDPTEANYGGSSAFGSNRQGYISLSGGFGELRLGRQYTGLFGVNAGFDAGGTVSGAGYLQSSDSYGEWLSVIRANNAVRYQTPTMNGFWLAVAMIDDSSKTTSNAGVVTSNSEGSGQSITGSYAAGPLAAMLSWSTSDVVTVATAAPAVDTKVETERLNLGVSYNLGVLSLHVTHNQREVDDAKATNLDSDRSDTTIGVKVPVGAATIWASTGEGEQKRKGLSAASANIDYSAYQLGVSYALSKRTNVYAFMGEDEGKVKSTNVKTTNEGMYFGVRHTF
jgi:predicted porin